jgi:hypothetical protein
MKKTNFIIQINQKNIGTKSQRYCFKDNVVLLKVRKSPLHQKSADNLILRKRIWIGIVIKSRNTHPNNSWELSTELQQDLEEKFVTDWLVDKVHYH